ncbi:MAG: ROK family protein [Usitatibacteraceae bacterium]
MRFGIDLGGTKIEILALDERGEERYRHRVAAPQGSYAETLAAIAALVKNAEATLGETGSVGIATPGAVSRAPASTGRLKNANSIWLNGQPLVADLQAALKRDIRIENDANCFALSEATDGAAAGATNVFGVILGTGTGGGICLNGRIVTGANAIGGEWGHNPLPWPQPNELPGNACYCGQHGCIETWLSGPALAKHFYDDTGRTLSAPEIVANAAQDGACEAALAAYEDRLARSLASIINVLDPDVIVLGGGVSKVSRWYQTVPTLWTKYVFSDYVATRLVPPKFGDASGVRGAAWLWNNE